MRAHLVHSHTRRGLWWLWIAVLTVLWLASCQNEDPADPDPFPDTYTVNYVVEMAGGFPFIVPDSTAFAVARFDSADSGGGPLSCTTYAGTQRDFVPVLTIPAPDTARHYAGAVLQFGSLTTATTLPVNAARAGGVLTLSTPADDAASDTVAVLSGNVVEAWRQQVLAELGDTAPEPWALSVRAVHSDDHVALAAGVAPEAMPPALREYLRLRDTTSGRALVRLVRVHHTVTATWPGSARAAFAPHVTGYDLDGQMAPGNPPVWVKSVHYGQLVLVLVEAAAPPADVADAVERTFRAAIQDVPPASGPLLSDLPELGVRVFAAGAAAAAIEAAAAAGPSVLADALDAPLPAAVELPMVNATLVALRNGELVKLPITASFAFELCEDYVAVFDQALWGYRAADAHTIRLSGDLDTNGWGRFTYRGGSRIYTLDHVTFLPDLVGGGGNAIPDGRNPVLLPNAVGGRPAVELYELQMPTGYFYSRLHFDGSSLVGREYTIFIVMGVPQQVYVTIVTDGNQQVLREVNRLNYFLHGTSANLRHNLRIGYTPAAGDSMVFSHRGFQNELKWRQEAPFYQWHVYAFRFGFDGGVSPGMSAFVDGEQIAHNPDRTSSLIGYPGATLAARQLELAEYSLAVVLIAEIMAYDGAGSDADVLAETERLRAKYLF